jgi:type IX secretion system PorP/SprF family membrane protein
MIRAFLIFPMLLLFGVVFAQQDPQYSQYMQNNLSINPGYAGSKDAICASALHREQWVGLKGAPSTSVFNIDASVKPFKINSGVGLTILNDNIGFDKNLGLNLAYAYRMNVNNGNGKLGIGIGAGIYNKALNATWDAGKSTGNVDATSDPGIPSEKESATAFDLNFGLFYKSENVYFGLSSTHLTQPKFSYQKGTPSLKRHYYLTTGYNIALPNPSFDIQPSVFIGTDGSTTRVDLNTIVVYNKRIWGGVSYRLSSAIVGMLGIELSNGLKIGYSYDFATSDIRKYSSGTHEIMIGYCFNIVTEKIPHKYKSIRFL